MSTHRDACRTHWGERRLAREAMNGSDAAYAELALRYMPMIRTICRFRIRDSFTASETANDILHKVIETVRQYAKGRGKLATWIGNIAHNTCTDVLRARGVEHISLEEEVRSGRRADNLIVTDVYGPNREMKRIDRRYTAILNAMSTLSERDQYIIRLRALGHSFCEIGVFVELSRNAAKLAYWRAIQKIKQLCGVRMRIHTCDHYFKAKGA